MRSTHKPLSGAFEAPPLSVLSSAVRLSLLGFSLMHGASQAATVEVTSNADDGTGCTLREAIVSINTQTLQSGCINSSANSFGTNDSITFSNSLAASNTISIFGGGLNIDPGRTVEISASNITGGVTVDANKQSRVFYINSATVSIDQLTIRGGSTTASGGGLFANDSSSVIVRNSTVSGNTAGKSGGGLFVSLSSSIRLSNSTISDNLADNGGGLSASSSSTSLSKSTVSGNSARIGGGLSATNASSFSVNDSIVSGNSANDGGGLVALNSSSISLDNSTVERNIATDDGGGLMALNSSSISLDNSTVERNVATDDGGGLHAHASSSVSLLNSSFSKNSADFSGGGVSARSSSSITLINSTLSENLAYYGGGFGADSSLINLSNSTLSGNSATFGGGFYAHYSPIRLNNSTLSGNAAYFGGGFYAYYRSPISLSNSIIADSIGGSDCSAGPQLVNNDAATIIEDGSCGALRSGDPGLMPLSANGGSTRTHALKADSIARNSGVLSGATGRFENCTTHDQRGQQRDDGDGFCDVGAIEFNANDAGGFNVIPLGNGKMVVIPL